MSDFKKFTDETLMPFGKHKGKKLANVPASYLIYLYNEDIPEGGLEAYIEENMEVLEDVVEKEKLERKWE